jgi:hypothetical protein
MAISTFSRFYFGYEVELGVNQNNKLNFNEGGGELTSTIPLGVYSPTELAEEIAEQMTADGGQAYTVTFNRSDRSFTISAAGTFDLLVSSGTNASASIFSTIGFTGADRTGAITYTGSVSGSEYITQFPPQDYVAPGFRVIKSDAAVNVAADGTVEVVSFSDVDFVKFNLQFITDITMDGKVIRTNPTGVQDAIDFLTFAIKRGQIEFMPDKDDVNTFHKMVLEKTRADSKGVGFELREETGKNLPGIYQTGALDFRIVE